MKRMGGGERPVIPLPNVHCKRDVAKLQRREANTGPAGMLEMSITFRGQFCQGYFTRLIESLCKCVTFAVFCVDFFLSFFFSILNMDILHLIFFFFSSSVFFLYISFSLKEFMNKYFSSYMSHDNYLHFLPPLKISGREL